MRISRACHRAGDHSGTELETTVTRSDQLQEQLNRHSRDSANTAERELRQLQEDQTALQTKLAEVRASVAATERESRTWHGLVNTKEMATKMSKTLYRLEVVEDDGGM